MKTFGVALAFAAALPVGAAPAPHCQFAHAPVVLCETAANAAAAWHLYGSNQAAVLDSNNRELMRQAGCVPVLKDASSHKLLENQSGRVATRWGWTRVAFLTVDGRDWYYVAGNYLRGTCEQFSTVGAHRDERPLGPYDPTPFVPTPSNDPDAPSFAETPVGKIGVSGSTFP